MFTIAMKKGFCLIQPQEATSTQFDNNFLWTGWEWSFNSGKKDFVSVEVNENVSDYRNVYIINQFDRTLSNVQGSLPESLMYFFWIAFISKTLSDFHENRIKKFFKEYTFLMDFFPSSQARARAMDWVLLWRLAAKASHQRTTLKIILIPWFKISQIQNCYSFFKGKWRKWNFFVLFFDI